MSDGKPGPEIWAYLSGLALGNACRVRDLLLAGRADEALEAAREYIAVNLRHTVADADEAWISGMVTGEPRAPGCR